MASTFNLFRKEISSKRDSLGGKINEQQRQKKKNTTTKKKRKVILGDNDVSPMSSPDYEEEQLTPLYDSSMTASPNNQGDLRFKFNDLYLTETILEEGEERDDLAFLNTTTEEENTTDAERIERVLDENVELTKLSSHRGRASEIHGYSKTRISNEVCTNLRETIINELDLKEKKEKEKIKIENEEPDYIVKSNNFFEKDNPYDNDVEGKKEPFGMNFSDYIEVVENDLTSKAVEILLRFSRCNSANNFNNYDKNDNNKHALLRAKIPLIEPDYIHKYLRQPRGEEFFERNCSREQKCFSILLSAKTSQKGTKKVPEFILREFLLPEEEAKLGRTKQLPRQRKMCWICTVFITNILYSILDKKERKKIDIEKLCEKYKGLIKFFASQEGSATFLIQDHGVVTEETKSQLNGSCYSSDVVLPPSVENGLILPFRRFPNNLTVTTEEITIDDFGTKGTIYRYIDTDVKNFQ